MKILAEDHSFTISDRDGGVKGSPLKIFGGFTVSHEEDFKIFDSLLKKWFFIFFFNEERDLTFSN